MICLIKWAQKIKSVETICNIGLEKEKNCLLLLDTNVCNSGCRSRALFLTGDIYDADPGACYLHQLVHKEIMSMLPNYVQSIYEGYINANGLEPKYNTENFKRFLKEKGYNA